MRSARFSKPSVMTLSFPSYKDQLQTLVLGFLWRQWTALGVAGQAHPQENRVIDPEALLLVTTTFAGDLAGKEFVVSLMEDIASALG